MRKISQTSYTGSDTILMYDIGRESGDESLSHIRVIHLQEWSDLVGEIEAEDMEKYNVVVHDVCVYGYDGVTALSGEVREIEPRVGKSVHDALRSAGMSLHRMQTSVQGMYYIREDHSGNAIAQGLLTDPSMAVVIAEAMYGYGAGDRVHDESGNNARQLLRSARAA